MRNAYAPYINNGILDREIILLLTRIFFSSAARGASTCFSIKSINLQFLLQWSCSLSIHLFSWNNSKVTNKLVIFRKADYLNTNLNITHTSSVEGCNSLLWAIYSVPNNCPKYKQILYLQQVELLYAFPSYQSTQFHLHFS